MIATTLFLEYWPFIGRDSRKDIEKLDSERYVKKINQQIAVIRSIYNTI